MIKVGVGVGVNPDPVTTLLETEKDLPLALKNCANFYL